MIRRVWFGVLVSLLLLLVVPSNIRAEGTACGHETIIIPDGRVTNSFIPNGSTFFYLITGQPGHSYSVEFRNTTGAAIAAPGTLTVYSDGACSTVLSTTSTVSDDPQDDFNMQRVSFTIAPTGGQIRFTLANSSGAGISYSFSATDTTLFSTRWSTFSGFYTSYGFTNTTGTALSVTLTLTDTAGTVVGTSTLPIPAGRVVYTSTTALGVAANDAGSATLTYNGPPGAILADAILANFTTSPPTTLISKFEERHSAH